MKAEGNIFYPLVVQSQRDKERGAHSRYIISYHIVGIWTSWYEDRWVVCVRTGEEEKSAYNGTTLQKTLWREQDILWYQKQAHP